MSNTVESMLGRGLVALVLIVLAGCDGPANGVDGGMHDGGGNTMDATTQDHDDADVDEPDADVSSDEDASVGDCDVGCDDGNPCNGEETCEGGTCVPGDPITCDPSDSCHSSACDAATGSCVETLIDADEDGFASTALGACGTDCDDASADVHPGASETAADGIDQDCDGVESCFVDADRDGFRTDALVVSVGDFACTTTNGEAGAGQPLDCNDSDASIHEGATEGVGDEIDSNCDGAEICYMDLDHDGYRTTVTVASPDVFCNAAGEARASAAIDCCDLDARAHPGQTVYFGASDGARACGGWDFNCDGAEERRDTTTASCFLTSGSVPMCMFSHGGWRSSVPACGASASFTTSCTGTGSCTFISESRDQMCH